HQNWADCIKWLIRVILCQSGTVALLKFVFAGPSKKPSNSSCTSNPRLHLRHQLKERCSFAKQLINIKLSTSFSFVPPRR
ncbi:hypothetical protein CMV_023005, partial [Castanea mollissima]